MPRPRRLGADAEDRAAAHLLGKGYTLVTRRFKARHGEIDLIAFDGETLVIVEVKERAKGGSPEFSMSGAKAAKLALAAAEYVAANDLRECPIRYDLICFDSEGMRHYENAFRPD